MEHLGITFSEASGTRVVAQMPVERRVQQPFGLLHGGASVVLAETVASTGTYLSVKDRGMVAVGLEINANHLRGVSAGTVTATGTPIFEGRTTEVWSIEKRGKTVCISRCTLAVIPIQRARNALQVTQTPLNLAFLSERSSLSHYRSLPYSRA